MKYSFRATAQLVLRFPSQRKGYSHGNEKECRLSLIFQVIYEFRRVELICSFLFRFGAVCYEEGYFQKSGSIRFESSRLNFDDLRELGVQVHLIFQPKDLCTLLIRLIFSGDLPPCFF